jgi:hypothetical protein
VVSRVRTVGGVERVDAISPDFEDVFLGLLADPTAIAREAA